MSWIKGLIARNAGAKLIAIGGAAVIWAALGSESSGHETFDAAIRYRNVPEGMEVNPDQAGRVSVMLAGPQRLLRSLRREGVTVFVDCRDVFDSQQHTVTLTKAALRLPASVDLVRSVPSQLRFSLEISERREVEVVPNFVGPYEEGYVIDDYWVSPAKLAVAGPADRVRLIEQVSTDPISLHGVIGGRKFQTTAFLSDPYLRFEADPAVTVEVRMRKR